MFLGILNLKEFQNCIIDSKVMFNVKRWIVNCWLLSITGFELIGMSNYHGQSSAQSLCNNILYPYKDKTRDIRSNIALRLREFPKTKPEGTSKKLFQSCSCPRILISSGGKNALAVNVFVTITRLYLVYRPYLH